MSSLDLELIAGRFFDQSLAKSKLYLLKYFRESGQRNFLTYYFEFGSIFEQSPGRFYRSYREHTGIACTDRVIQKWTKRIRLLESIVEKANAALDFETLANVKEGNYRIE